MASYKIISFYKPGEKRDTIEYLVQHIDEMIKLIHPSSKALVYGEALLKQLITDEYVEPTINYPDLLYTTIVFHDIGKAFYRYNVEQAIRRKSTAYYTGHEILSAIILEELIKTLEEECLNKNYDYYTLLTPSIFAVMFHHHALSIERRAKSPILLSIVKKLDTEYVFETITILKHDLRHIIENNRLTKPLFKLLEEKSNEITRLKNDIIRRYIELRTRLLDKLRAGTNTTTKKLMYLTLTNLICIDYEAARKTRKEEPSIFGKMCNQWKKYYLE